MINLRRFIFLCTVSIIYCGPIVCQDHMTDEIHALNDVLGMILAKQSPSNPTINLKIDDIYEPSKSSLRILKPDSAVIRSMTDEINSREFLLYIPDTFFSLNDLIRKNRWIYRDEPYEPMYRLLMKQGKLSSLDDLVFNTQFITNTWKYKISRILADDDIHDIIYTKLKISRVCFNPTMTLGFFYIEVLTQGDNGYVTLILIEKDKNSKRWYIVNGTYYD